MRRAFTKDLIARPRFRYHIFLFASNSTDYILQLAARDCPLNRRKRYTGPAAASAASVCRPVFPTEPERKQKTSDLTPPKLNKQKKQKKSHLRAKFSKIAAQFDDPLPLQTENIQCKVAVSNQVPFVSNSCKLPRQQECIFSFQDNIAVTSKSNGRAKAPNCISASVPKSNSADDATALDTCFNTSATALNQEQQPQMLSVQKRKTTMMNATRKPSTLEDATQNPERPDLKSHIWDELTNGKNTKHMNTLSFAISSHCHDLGTQVTSYTVSTTCAAAEEKRREYRVINLLNFTTSTTNKFDKKAIITGEQNVTVAEQPRSGVTATPTPMNAAHFGFKKSVSDLASPSDSIYPRSRELLVDMTQVKQQEEHFLTQWSNISDHYIALKGLDSFDNDFWISPQKETFP